MARESSKKKARIGPAIMEYATEEEYKKFLSDEVKNEMELRVVKTKSTLAKHELSRVEWFKDAFEKTGGLDSRHIIELCDF